jgi:hypothetical protein
MGLGFPVLREAFPKQTPRDIKMGMSGDLLGDLLEGELLVVGLFLPVVPLVLHLLVSVMF